MEEKLINGKAADNSISIQDLWAMFLPKWRWFLISLIITLSLTALYLLSTPNIYTRTAAILVKDDSKGSNIAGSSEFNDFGIFKSNTNINNELLTLTSPTLMTEVVTRLGLNEKYVVRNGLKKKDLYNLTPVTVTFADNKTDKVEFTIKMESGETFTLSNFKLDKEDFQDNVKGKIGETIDSPAGKLTLTATPYLSDSYIGTPIKYTRGDVMRTADNYTSALTAVLGNKDATIINLSINDASIRKAEDILNTLIEVYNEKWIQNKNQIAVSTSRFISDRLGVIENELGHVDQDISSYKSENLLPDVQAASNLYLTQSAENRKELLGLNNQLSTARFIRRELNSKAINQPLPSNSGISNANIENQIGEYNNMVLDRNRLVANSSEKNPLVEDLTNSLQSMKRTIVQSVDNLIVSLETQIRSTQSQEAATTSRLASNPNQAKYLLSVERQQKVKEELYLFLLQKREENELSQAFTAYNTQLITAPRGNDFPTAPKKKLIVLAALMLGLLIPAAVIYLMEMLNTRVRGRKDLEGMSVPMIGEIPNINSNKKKWALRKQVQEEGLKLVVKEGSRNIINEAFRVLRSNLDFMVGRESKKNVIVITSYNPGSGKSFLAVNMSMSYAIKKKKVLLIDGDMRHGSTSTYVGSPDRGLSNYLGGTEESWKSLIVPDKKFSNLHILPIGTVPPNPTELLEEGMLAQLIETARDEYDFILIDCPPIDIVADTQIIEKLADRTLFVVCAGLLERNLLPELENFYQEKRFKNLSIILNKTENAGGRYGYRYGYGSYYGQD